MKPPAMQFYVKDWKADTDGLSPAAKGAWIQICCTLHLAKKRGRATRKPAAWARIIGCPVDEVDTLLHEIDDCECADVTFHNDRITVVSRRMERERKEKEDNALRQRRHRGKRLHNEKVTSPSASASATASAKKKECDIGDAGILPEHDPRPGYVVERSDAPEWSKEDMAVIAYIKAEYAKWIELVGGNKARQVMPRTWNSKIVEAYRQNGGDYIRAVTAEVLKAAYNGCQDKRYWGWGVIEQHVGKPTVRRDIVQPDAEFAALPWEEQSKWERKVLENDATARGDSNLDRLRAKAAAMWRKVGAAEPAGSGETRSVSEKTDQR